jgi:hypothetical protein
MRREIGQLAFAIRTISVDFYGWFYLARICRIDSTPLNTPQEL